MKTILIGNDISFRWDVREKGGSPFDLEGKEVALYRKGFSGNVRIGEVSVKGNVVSWSWPGREQTSPGTYSFLLVVNEGGDGMHSLDTGPVVTLVSSSRGPFRVGFPDREDLGGILGDYLIAVEKAGKAAALAEESALKADKAADKAMGVVQESAESLKDKLDIHNYFEIMGSSAMRPVYEACGAVWNEETGYYELNGLTDITEEDILNDWLLSYGMFPNASYRANKLKRTNFPPVSYMQVYYGVDFSCSLAGSDAEVFNLWPLDINGGVPDIGNRDGFFFPLRLNSSFNSNRRLREILGFIDMSRCTIRNGMSFALASPELREIRILNLDHNINFASDSPLLSYESVKCLVDNAATTAPRTVTIGPVTYSYLSGSAQPSADVGGTTEEWQALMTAAAGKQISFATEE